MYDVEYNYVVIVCKMKRRRLKKGIGKFLVHGLIAR